MVWRLEYWYGWIGWDGHKFWLDRNDGHWDRHGLVVFVSVSVDTQLLRYLLADSHWRLLVDFMANFIWHILGQILNKTSIPLLLTLQISYGFCAHFLSGMSLQTSAGTS